MQQPDLNLLRAFDVLLAEKNLNAAAKRLQQTPAATRHLLNRLRKQFNDPLLVRSGRGFTLTVKAAALQPQVSSLIRQAQTLLTANTVFDPAQLQRHFRLAVSEGFIETFGAALIRYLQQQAPHTELHFSALPPCAQTALRQEKHDAVISMQPALAGTDLMSDTLYQEGWIGLVRPDNPLLHTKVTPKRYAEGVHIGTEQARDLDPALAALSLTRQIGIQVDSHLAAISLARSSHLIATVPERSTQTLRFGLHCFPLPFNSPTLCTYLHWHARVDADPAHQWFRHGLAQVCRQLPTTPESHVALGSLPFKRRVYEK